MIYLSFLLEIWEGKVSLVQTPHLMSMLRLSTQHLSIKGLGDVWAREVTTQPSSLPGPKQRKNTRPIQPIADFKYGWSQLVSQSVRPSVSQSVSQKNIYLIHCPWWKSIELESDIIVAALTLTSSCNFPLKDCLITPSRAILAQNKLWNQRLCETKL